MKQWCVYSVFPAYSISGGNEMHMEIDEFKCFEDEGWSYI